MFVQRVLTSGSLHGPRPSAVARDVRTDLAVVMEQLPGVLVGLRQERAFFGLDFYEQGIERYITGTREGGIVRLECASMSLRWSWIPAVEVVPADQASAMFRELRDRYVTSVQRACPRLAVAAAFKDWLASTAPVVGVSIPSRCSGLDQPDRRIWSTGASPATFRVGAHVSVRA